MGRAAYERGSAGIRRQIDERLAAGNDWSHLDHLENRLMAAKARIAELEAELAAARAEIACHDAEASQLFAEIEKADRRAEVWKGHAMRFKRLLESRR